MSPSPQPPSTADSNEHGAAPQSSGLGLPRRAWKPDGALSEEVSARLEAFQRDGYVEVPNAVTPEQLAILRGAADAEIREILAADPDFQGNRNVGIGGRRYSFGSVQQFPRQEWAQLLDYLLPTCGPLMHAIFGSADYKCIGAGGDFSLPGAQYQPLHSDLFGVPGFPVEPPGAPPGAVTINHLPVPFVCINLPLVDFTPRNGPTRQVPGTQSSLEPIPTLDEEPAWMKQAFVCAKAGSALIRDVRAWHGGSPNLLPVPPEESAIGCECMGKEAGYARPMLNVEFTAPWFRLGARDYGMLPREWWEAMSPESQRMTKNIIYDGPLDGRRRDDLYGDRAM